MSDLPRGWKIRSLADVADVVRGVTYRQEQCSQRAGPGLVPLLRATNIGHELHTDGECVYVPEAIVKPAQWLRKGDIVLAASSGSISVVGKSARLVSSWRGTFGAFCAVIRPHDDVEARFLALYIRSEIVRRRWSEAARGTNINNLKRGDLTTTPVPVPSTHEQRRIVEVLEDHLSRLDAAGRSLQRSVEQLSIVRLSFLVDTRRELIANRTALEPIGALCDTALGKMLDAKKESGESTPYLRNINIRWGHIDLGDVSVVPLTSAERQRLALRPGDLMVCEGGEPGRCAVWEDDAELICYQKALHRVRVRDNRMDPYFVAAMLEETVRTGRADRLFTGTTIKHLPQEKLRAVQIPVPAPEIQRSILRRLIDQDVATQRLDRQIEQEKRRAANLRRALLQAAFMGQLARQPVGVESTEEIAGV